MRHAAVTHEALLTLFYSHYSSAISTGLGSARLGLSQKGDCQFPARASPFGPNRLTASDKSRHWIPRWKSKLHHSTTAATPRGDRGPKAHIPQSAPAGSRTLKTEPLPASLA